MFFLLLPLMAGILVCKYTLAPSALSVPEGREAYYRYRADLIQRNQPHAWYSPVTWQQRLRERFQQLGIDGDELGTIEALTLGYKGDLNPEIKKQFRRSGASHVLAVSGLHVGIIYFVLFQLLTLFETRKPLYEERGKQAVLSSVVVILLWLYALLTGMSASVVRAVTMCSIAELARVCHREAFSFNTLFLTAFLVLAIAPAQLFSISFQLSFAAVAAILFCAPKRWPLITVSLAAQAGVMPISLYYFSETSNWFMLTNIGVLTLAPFVVGGALVVLVLGGIPVLGPLLVAVLQLLIRLMHGWVELVDMLPCATTRIVTDLPMVVALYGAIVCGILTLKHKLWWLVGTALSLTAFILLYLR